MASKRDYSGLFLIYFPKQVNSLKLTVLFSQLFGIPAFLVKGPLSEGNSSGEIRSRGLSQDFLNKF